VLLAWRRRECQSRGKREGVVALRLTRLGLTKAASAIRALAILVSKFWRGRVVRIRVK